MVGMARKKEYSAAERLSVPSSRAPAMVAPERDTPGTSARHWNRPMPRHKPERIVHDVVLAGLQRHAVEHQQDDAADQQRQRDQDQRVEEDAGDDAVQEDAEEGGRQEGDEDAENEALRARVARQVGDDLPEASGIDSEQGEDGAELDEHGEAADALEAEHVLGEKQMRRRGDRQELREALQHAEDYGIDDRLEVHGGPPPPANQGRIAFMSPGAGSIPPAVASLDC